MSVTLSDLLSPQVIMGSISRIKVGQGVIGKWLGWHYDSSTPGSGGLLGPNTRESPTRSGVYRIMDDTRTVMQGRAPGTGPGWTPVQPMGEIGYTCCRLHEKMRLQAELLGAMAKFLGPNSEIDVNGQQYIKEQETFLARRFNNAIELMAAGLVRGSFYMRSSGESWYPCINVPAAPYVKVDLRVPVGNTLQLNMLGEGNIIGTTWASAAAPIISHDLPMIMDAYVQLTGIQPTDFWLGPLTWAALITNSEVTNAAGSSNTPFEFLRYTDPAKGRDGGMVAVLRGYPMITWHITSEVLVDNGGTDPSYAAGTGKRVKVIPDNCISIMPPADEDWQKLITFGEPISEKPGMPMQKHSGFYLWHEEITQPSALEIIGLANCTPFLFKPLALVLGTVIF